MSAVPEPERWYGYWRADRQFHVKQDRRQHAGPASIIVVANQKGGVGKTTTAVSVAAALAQQDRSVLLVDSDPQANCTSGVGIRLTHDQPSIYEVLGEGLPAAKVIEQTDVSNLWLLPSSIDLAGAEIELVSALSSSCVVRWKTCATPSTSSSSTVHRAWDC
jgi:chromosome partitioning protein